ncbi:MAG TPA: hypothetical protein VIH75_00575 [Candidatus Sulfotelmatobacter sp.]|jgi:hypothetical protein
MAVQQKVFGVQLFVTCSLPLLAALSVAGAQVADVTPKFDGVHVDALDADAWNGVVFAAGGSGSLPTWLSDLDRSARRLSRGLAW